MWYCPSCGSDVHEKAAMCGSCGSRRPTAAEGVYVHPDHAVTTKKAPLDRCPKCDGTMTDGFLGQYAGFWSVPILWKSGIVKWSIWWGYRAETQRGSYPVRARRCDHCGHLELSALR
jgi:hypothetical protein